MFVSQTLENIPKARFYEPREKLKIENPSECSYVTGNVWNQSFYRMPRQSIEYPAGQAFYRIPRQSIECQADQSFYRMPEKNSQTFYRMPEYLRYSYTETILITHEGPFKN